MLSSSQARERDVQSLRNWLDGNGCLAREETEYLSHRGDLVSLAAPGDNAVVQLEAWVEDKVIKFHRRFRESRFHDISNDSNVYIYSGPLIKRTAKGILLLVITLFLLAPVVICNSISAITIRIVVVMVSIVTYLLVLSGLTMSRTMELILAGVT
ncbi:hypothetical protein UCREL1_4267 [Eutypa lata UCREL1]|uniref:DUF6594 domain-containing protein n=1 Tax=Eutypa lata (strain UCR-EL1) TaxID=1287681 RepID=M7TPT6_EUTLA|nr:hypothetical protein UCREL1_4267 [Eutypa lata UCREL1]